MIYFDTSYIAKCYLNEPHAERVRELARDASGLASAHLGRLEFWSVLNRHVRERRLTAAQAARIRSLLAEDEDRGVWTWFPLSPRLLADACSALERLPATMFVRAGDALHLACARDQGFKEIYSHDSHILECAAHFGIEGRDVIGPSM